MYEEFYREFIWGTVERLGPDVIIHPFLTRIDMTHWERDWYRNGGTLRVTVRAKTYDIDVPFVPRAVRVERKEAK
jgi:hypothetical protein